MSSTRNKNQRSEYSLEQKKTIILYNIYKINIIRVMKK